VTYPSRETDAFAEACTLMGYGCTSCKFPLRIPQQAGDIADFCRRMAENEKAFENDIKRVKIESYTL